MGFSIDKDWPVTSLRGSLIHPHFFLMDGLLLLALTAIFGRFPNPCSGSFIIHTMASMAFEINFMRAHWLIENMDEKRASEIHFKCHEWHWCGNSLTMFSKQNVAIVTRMEQLKMIQMAVQMRQISVNVRQDMLALDVTNVTSTIGTEELTVNLSVTVSGE